MPSPRKPEQASTNIKVRLSSRDKLNSLKAHYRAKGYRCRSQSDAIDRAHMDITGSAAPLGEAA